MIKRLVAFFSALLFSAVGVAQTPHCSLPFFFNQGQLPLNTAIAGGPTIISGVLTIPGLADAIANAALEWNKSDAIGRFGNWSGVTSTSDCPAGQPFQLGALDFVDSTCPTLAAYNVDPYTYLAFTDFFRQLCPQCGTRSVSINLHFPWSLNPNPGEYDLQSVLTHELGHVLGLAHMENGVCVEPTSTPATPSCAASPGRETMARVTYPAISSVEKETCGRDLTLNDIPVRTGCTNL